MYADTSLKFGTREYAYIPLNWIPDFFNTTKFYFTDFRQVSLLGMGQFFNCECHIIVGNEVTKTDLKNLRLEMKYDCFQQS